MSSKLLRGTFVLTSGTFISKFLGLFYVIPFFALVGNEGTALYNYAYVPYTIFISIATAGIPASVSKFISKYNAIEEYAVGRKLFKTGLVLMAITGIISFLILYIAAPTLAAMVITDPDFIDHMADVTTVIRAVSFALIIIPFMSIIRGFFQGHQSMEPTAVSQVVEQIVRIAFVLAGAYIVLKVAQGSLVTAVSFSVFAAFIGGLGGLAVLFWYWVKKKPMFDELLLRDRKTMDISVKDIYKEILLYSIPFVLVGIANPLFQFIDQLTFNPTMVSMGYAFNEAEHAFSILNFQAQKLVIIPVSLATAFSLTLIPAVTKSYTEQDQLGLNRQLNQTFQVLTYLTLPAALGLSLLAEPFYTVFYEPDALGAEVLEAYAPIGMLFALYAVTAAILQGIDAQKFNILSLLVGILIKLSLNIPLIKLMETKGAILATALGYSVAILINLFVIKAFSKYRFRLVFRRGILIVIFTAIMYFVTKLVYYLLTMFLSPDVKLEALIMVALCAIAGAGVYFYLGLKSKLVNFLFGARVDRIKEKLRLKV
ncbi:polysaccharide biosynthesis protein [Robertmurraya sp. DFI.2.37]|jgi:O-antigen/teichoic acid export membrane protein|uniref:putative polysaccharide biosynthesis protein n=1 Tax=Robertmurraya sp. DFI.2.37 TaxID=3031819 RepID=UPI0012441819|nr:polysaccharide biosynthesis protein [Robertmurraya sp. DFI.2.37]MDF1508666.1 polysaccharide biosynthesis protein [Robertmurraya sp. DFI.2.37]